MLAKGRARHTQEAVCAGARHGKVALDAAARVERLRVHHRANRPVHIVGADVLQKGQRAGTAHFQLAEGCFVKDGSAVARSQMLHTNGSRPVVGSPARRLVPVLRRRCVRLKPVGPLPAKLFTKRRTQLTQLMVRRREAQVAHALAFLVGIVNVVIFGVGLNRARPCVFHAVVVGAKAAHIQAPHIPFGMSVHNPLGHNLANATSSGQPVCTECSRHPKPRHGRRAQQVLAIRRKSFRAVEQRVHLGRLKQRHTPD